MITQTIEGEVYEFTEAEYAQYLACVAETGDMKNCAEKHGTPVEPDDPPPPAPQRDIQSSASI